MSDQAGPIASAEIQRRLDAILERFPDRFSETQVAEIRTRVSQTIANGTNLAGLKLPNGAGPWFDPRSMADE